MPVDYNMSLPSWLNPRESFSDAITKGVSAGTSMAHNFLSSQVAHHAMGMEDAMMPLKMKALDQRLTSTGLEIQAKQREVDDDIANKEGYSELADTAAQISGDGAWSDPSNEARIYDIGRRYPSLTSTRTFQDYVKRFDVAGAMALKKQEAETRASKVQGELDISQQKNQLAGAALDARSAKWAADLAAKDQQLQDTLASKEAIAKGHDAAKIEAAKTKIAHETVSGHLDVYDRQGLKMLDGYAKKLKDDPNITPEQMGAKLQRYSDRLNVWSKDKKGEPPNPDASGAPASPAAPAKNTPALPDPSKYKNGTVAKDKRSGSSYILKDGQWAAQ